MSWEFTVKYLNEINIFGVLITFSSLILGIISFLYSRKVAKLQKTFNKDEILILFKNYKLKEIKNIYFAIPYPNDESCFIFPFRFEIFNNGNKTAKDVNIQIITNSMLQKAIEFGEIVTEGHCFNKVDSSVVSIGHKKSLALYFEKIKPKTKIGCEIIFTIYNPILNIKTKVDFIDQKNVSVSTRSKFNYILQLINFSDESEPVGYNLYINIIDTSKEKIIDMYYNFNISKIKRFFENLLILFKMQFIKGQFANFILFIIKKSDLKNVSKFKNIFELKDYEKEIEVYKGILYKAKILNIGKI